MESFKITDYIEFDAKGRAVCPACEQAGKTKGKTLSLVPDTDGAYKCFRSCTPKEIRDALGVSSRQLPTALVKPVTIPKTQVSPQKIKEACETLAQSSGPAKVWLHNRGISDALIERHQLGITRAKVGEKYLPAITIPIPSDDGTAYWQKKRVAPWLKDEELAKSIGPNWQNIYKPWSQAGIPARVFFTWLPAEARGTWLCEGEWDAILLGNLLRESDQPIAVASFTCGCGTVPPPEQLELLPGKVTIFYDRNDKPNKNGDRPGEMGARKVAEKLGDRGRIALVPMPNDCQTAGWDVTDALRHGYQLADFQACAQAATSPIPSGNPLRERLLWNDELIDSAPDYTEWLVADIFTTDELFLVASGPRAGKSLLAMTLSLAVASGGDFLGRPVIQGTVVYVCLEDSKSKIKEREQAQGWSRGLPVVWLTKFKLSELGHLEEIVAELDARLLVIDTLSRAKDASVSESSAEMSQVLEPLQDLASKLNCCVLLVHHTGKVNVDNASQIDLFDTIRGSSAIRAVCRGSMVIAAGERDYRLVVENGWGKHDLKVVLDANTLKWKALGNWQPSQPENSSQKDQILDFLRKTQQATLEQIHEATGIPKKSLYEQLSRLQASDIAEEKVVKEGSRRNFTYRRALFNTIQQLNSVLNSGNPDPENDRGAIQQKSNFSDLGDQHPQSMQTGTEGMCQFAYLSENTLPPTNTDIVEYHAETQAEQGIRLFNSYSTPLDAKSTLSESEQAIQPIQHAIQQPERSDHFEAGVEYENGDRVEVWNGKRWVKGIYASQGQRFIVAKRANGLHQEHWVMVRRSRERVASPDLRHYQGGEGDALE